MNIQAALKSQYHAALAMLKQAIEQCPDDLWTGGSYPVAFWRVAYHTLFFTHLYLQPYEQAFRPWKQHRDEYECLDALPRAGNRPPKTAQPYTKAQIIEYFRLCDEMVDGAVDRLDLDAPNCGFHWYRLPKLDHQINNIRHVQHHAALLAGRLRLAGGAEVRWVGPM